MGLWASKGGRGGGWERAVWEGASSDPFTHSKTVIEGLLWLQCSSARSGPFALPRAVADPCFWPTFWFMVSENDHSCIGSCTPKQGGGGCYCVVWSL